MPLVKPRKPVRGDPPAYEEQRFFSWPVFLLVVAGLAVAGWCVWELANSIMTTANNLP